jgi:hypothetical protein
MLCRWPTSFASPKVHNVRSAYEHMAADFEALEPAGPNELPDGLPRNPSQARCFRLRNPLGYGNLFFSKK